MNFFEIPRRFRYLLTSSSCFTDSSLLDKKKENMKTCLQRVAYPYGLQEHLTPTQMDLVVVRLFTRTVSQTALVGFTLTCI